MTKPLKSMAASDDVFLIVVDSIDEALLYDANDSGKTILAVLRTLFRELPSWIRIVATSRPSEYINELKRKEV